jgi:hypothetical protein
MPSSDDKRKFYSSVVAQKDEKKFKITLRSKDIKLPDMIKNLLMSKGNPTEIKVGIPSLKSLRDGRVMIEASSKKEIDILGEKIGEKCGEELEVQGQKLGNPRLVPNNIPEDITTENAETTIIAQNPEIDLKEGDIRAKICYTTKRKTSILIIEVDPETRKKLLQARIMLGWSISRAFDYLVAKFAFVSADITTVFLNVREVKHVHCAQAATD